MRLSDGIVSLLALLHVWDLDLAEYIAMTQDVSRGSQGNLGEERNGYKKDYIFIANIDNCFEIYYCFDE